LRFEVPSGPNLKPQTRNIKQKTKKMNQIKKYLGLLWMAMAPLLIVFMAWQAWEKIGAASGSAKSNVTLQWVIILMVFIPICAGFFIFGKYSFHGDYAHLPESSGELDDYEEPAL
jgi:hypothetical protein